MQSETLELVLEDETAETDDILHRICLLCHLKEPHVCFCGVYDPTELVRGKEYLHCIVCEDYWEQGICGKGHVLRSL